MTDKERGMGDNSNDLTDKERLALFGHYARKDMALRAEAKRIADEKKENRLLAKADGFASSKLDHYVKSFTAEDKQAPVDKHMSEKENLIWLGLIPDQPGGDLLADRATNEQRIFAAGQAAGLVAADRMSGYDGGSVDDKTWCSGYDDGQRIVREHLQAAMEKKNAAKTNEAPEATGEDPFKDAAE